MSKKIVKLKERRQKKINQVRKSRQKRLLIIFLLIVLLLTGSWLVYTSNFFKVAEIKVQGNEHITDQQVIEKAAIKRSANLLTLPSKKIASRLRKLSWVLHPSVIRDWPDTVILDIIERKPIAYIQTEEKSFLIDNKAFIIDAGFASDKLAKIDGLPIKEYKTGSYLKNKVLDNALTAYKSLDGSLQKKVYSITAKSVEELYFVADGIEIIYGKAEKTKLKNKVIEAILEEKKESISTIDVRIPEKPVIRVLGK